MDVIDCIKSRRSIRKFKKKAVSDDIINKTLEAATYAPSSGNLQNWEFIIIKKQEAKNKLAEIALVQDFIAEAPVVIVVCSNQNRISPYGQRGRNLYSIQNTAAAIQNLLLTAWSFGIGSCWVGAFDENELSKFLELPKHIIPVAIIPLGYPDEKPVMPRRIPQKDFIWLEKYGRKL